MLLERWPFLALNTEKPLKQSVDLQVWSNSKNSWREGEVLEAEGGLGPAGGCLEWFLFECYFVKNNSGMPGMLMLCFNMFLS